mgnify:CR=1 FL=1
MTTSRMALAMAAALITMPGAQAETSLFPCGTGSFAPVRQPKVTREVAILQLFLFPLGGLFRDPLDGKPTTPVRFRVVDAAGADVPGALVAAIHRERGRYLAISKGASGQFALPHGEYDFNAVLPGRPIRWGTVAHTVAASPGSPVILRLSRSSTTGTAGAQALAGKAGQEITVGWQGERPPGSRIYFTRMGGKENNETPRAVDIAAGNGPFTVPLPPRPGRYRALMTLCAPEIKLAQWSVAVAKPYVRLEAPERVPAGQRFDVRVIESARLEGALVLDDPTEKRMDSRRMGEENDRSGYSFLTPVHAGPYRLKYEVDGEVVATRSITVTPVAFRLNVPERAGRNAVIIAEMPGIDPENLRFDVWTTGARPRRILSEVEASDLKIAGPPGRYEIRATDDGFHSRKTLARAIVTVE